MFLDFLGGVARLQQRAEEPQEHGWLVREWREGGTRVSRVVILTVECRGTLARGGRGEAAVAGDGDGGGRGLIREAAPVVTTKLRPPVEADLNKAVGRGGGWG